MKELLLKLCPPSTKVYVIQKIGDETEDSWTVVPFGSANRYKKGELTLPEGYELLGIGTVSRHDFESEKSKHGEKPILVQEYLHCRFNEDIWNHFSKTEGAE